MRTPIRALLNLHFMRMRSIITNSQSHFSQRRYKYYIDLSMTIGVAVLLDSNRTTGKRTIGFGELRVTEFNLGKIDCLPHFIALWILLFGRV